MQVVAFRSPSHPDWRWRIVDYTGDIREESREIFPSIATAVAEGTRRLRQLDDRDTSAPGYPSRGSHHQRGR